MYPSYSNGNSYPLDQNLPHTEEEPPPPSSLFYNFPSPSIPYEDDILLRQHLHDLFLQHPPQPSQAEYFLSNTDSNAQYQSGNEPIPMKKPSKKDRHSKIETAQGARDRRIRLSLEVAPQFFGLQDMLGFDKPGQTVSWLLNKSEDAIKELKKGTPYMTKSSSSNSEGEEGSGIDESPDLQEKNNSKGKGLISVVKEKKTRAPRKSAFGPLAKELREKAKTRAKERTREKKSRINETKLPNSEVINHEMNPSGSWTAFENCKESGSQSHNINPSPEFEAPFSSINVLFHYNQHNAGISQDEHQFTNYQADGKPWETYNNLNQF